MASAHFDIDTVVVGAGVVGLAVARELAMAGREVVILESTELIGSGTSSRNSEVIHAGIYYPPQSLKAALCVEGRGLLYALCEQAGVPYRRCGKLIVATNATQLAGLEKIERNARESGVSDLEWKTAGQAFSMEPSLFCVAALLSPSTGIIDSHGFMLALLGQAESHGAMLARCSEVQSGSVTPGGFELCIRSDGARSTLRCRQLINAAGLTANAVASCIDGLPDSERPPLHYAKGNYFNLAGKCPFTRLIYPIPEQAGLGVHLTIDLGGQGRFGPDVEWVDRPEYDVDVRRADGFYAEIRKYWPSLPDGALQPGYAGIRPKLVPKGVAAADFVINGPDAHGVPGLVNLFGIESPGLTASMAIARRVKRLLD